MTRQRRRQSRLVRQYPQEFRFISKFLLYFFLLAPSTFDDQTTEPAGDGGDSG